MPNWCENRLIIRLPEEVRWNPAEPATESDRIDHFWQLREFLAGTLRDNAEWVFTEADGSWCRDTEVTDIGCRGLFWGREFAIEDLGTHGATLSFLTKWSPPIGWVRRIHERYPAWRLRHGYYCMEWGSAGFQEWTGAEWIEHELSPEEMEADCFYKVGEDGGPEGEPFETIHRSIMEQVRNAATEGNLYVLGGIKVALGNAVSKIDDILSVQDPVYHAQYGKIGDKLSEKQP